MSALLQRGALQTYCTLLRYTEFNDNYFMLIFQLAYDL